MLSLPPHTILAAFHCSQLTASASSSVRCGGHHTLWDIYIIYKQSILLRPVASRCVQLGAAASSFVRLWWWLEVMSCKLSHSLNIFSSCILLVVFRLCESYRIDSMAYSLWLHRACVPLRTGASSCTRLRMLLWWLYSMECIDSIYSYIIWVYSIAFICAQLHPTA